MRLPIAFLRNMEHVPFVSDFQCKETFFIGDASVQTTTKNTALAWLGAVMQCIPWRFLFRNRRLLFRNPVLLNILNSLHFPTPWKSVRDFLKIGFYDQRLPTLKSVFNKLSKIFPAVSLGYIVFFPL